MTKADISEKIHTTIGLSKKDSLDMLESILSILKSTLETGEKIKISGFGTFEIKLKKDRIEKDKADGMW